MSAHRTTLALALVALAACRGSGAHEATPSPAAPKPAEPKPAVAAAPAAPAAGPLLPARAVTTPLEAGLSTRFYFVGEPMQRLCPLVANQTPNISAVRPVLDIDSDRGPDHSLGDLETTFLSQVDGYLDVPADGTYGLRLFCDDGGIVRVDGELAIDHDGLHSPSSRDVELALAKGLHALEVQHFQGYGGFALALSWRPPGASAFEIVPSAVLRCHKGEVRVTSPGSKKVHLPLDPGIPGDGLPLADVHPSLDIATVRPEGFEPRVGGIAWLPDGRMVITTWDAQGCVWILDGTAGDDRAQIKATRFAAGLAEPLGVATVGERIFVLQKQELTELTDHDKDGVADEYRCHAGGWGVSANFHEFAFGLVFKDDFFYFNLAIAIDPGGRSTQPQVPGRGATLKVALADGTTTQVAHGERTPNGIGIGVDGEIFVTDNQGDWLPCSKLLHLRQDAFYGSRAVLLEAAAELAVTPPVLWLPQNEIGNSPSNPTLIPASFGPYAGQMLHGDVTHGGVKRDFVELVDGQYQGCVFRFTQGLESGTNRIAFGPDGALYVGGIGSTGNWGQEKKQPFGLQRLKYNGKPTFEMLALRARSNGFEIEFTEPLASDVGWEIENYHVEQWRYVPTATYGGPKVGREELAVRSASVSEDRRRVFLELDGLQAEHVVYLRVVGPLVSEAHGRLWSTEAWYTLNRIPAGLAALVATPPAPKPQNQLSALEREQGWRLLFDGKSGAGWRAFRGKTLPAGWVVQEGALARTGGGGDIVTEEEFADFELALEWKIAPRGNSGVFFRVAEDADAVWVTGPEMQVLDNRGHADGRNPLTSAGSNYALHAPRWDATRPVGLWNRARMRVVGPHVEYWLNDVQVVEYELGGDAWNELVAASKFAALPRYGKERKGRIALQDHGDFVAYRNIKLRPLAAD